MQEYHISDAESKLADIIWEKAPVETSALVSICETKFTWKKSTTYTILKRLEGKGLFENRSGTVYILMAREDFYTGQSRQFVKRSFSDSLPDFLAAFIREKKLSEEEKEEIIKLIQEHKVERNFQPYVFGPIPTWEKPKRERHGHKEEEE